MKPPAFAYYDPPTLRAAVKFLAKNADSTKVLAGGQSLMPVLNMRLAAPDFLMDITRIPELDGIRETDTHVVIGATTRQYRVLESESVRQHLPLLHLALTHVGHAATRYRGTFGGSLVHADASAEIPSALLALDAEAVVHGPRGERQIALADFLVSYLTTALGADELLTEVRIPKTRGRVGFSVQEIARRHGDFALAGAMVQLRADGSGCIQEARIVAMGVGETPLRLDVVEQIVVGRAFEPAVWPEIEEATRSSVTPDSDMHGSEAFRRRLAGVLVRRAVVEAVAAFEPSGRGLEPGA